MALPVQCGVAPRAGVRTLKGLAVGTVAAAALSLAVCGPILAAEASSGDDGTAVRAASQAEGVAVQEDGLSLEAPAGTQADASGWWTYRGAGGTLMFQVYDDPACPPDLSAGAPSEEWYEDWLDSVFADSDDEYGYLGYAPYDNGDVSFYAYFFYNESAADGRLYVNFSAYVPLADGSVRTVSGGYFSSDIMAMFEVVDAMLATVEPEDAGAAAAGEVLSCGGFTFALPADVAFDVMEGDDGSVGASFAGPEGDCALLAYTIDVSDNNAATSSDELQQVGDYLMGTIVEGFPAGGGAVGVNDQSIMLYGTAVDVDGRGAVYLLVPLGNEMLVVSFFDDGSQEGYELINEVSEMVARTIDLTEDWGALEGDASAEDAAPDDLAAIADRLSGGAA